VDVIQPLTLAALVAVQEEVRQQVLQLNDDAGHHDAQEEKRDDADDVRALRELEVVVELVEKAGQLERVPRGQGVTARRVDQELRVLGALPRFGLLQGDVEVQERGALARQDYEDRLLITVREVRKLLVEDRA
jgi:hypothetical protein